MSRSSNQFPGLRNRLRESPGALLEDHEPALAHGHGVNWFAPHARRASSGPRKLAYRFQRHSATRDHLDPRSMPIERPARGSPPRSIRCSAANFLRAGIATSQFFRPTWGSRTEDRGADSGWTAIVPAKGTGPLDSSQTKSGGRFARTRKHESNYCRSGGTILPSSRCRSCCDRRRPGTSTRH